MSPALEHLCIKLQHALTSNAVWRWDKGCHRFINTNAVLSINARQQMPKRERVAWAGLTQHRCQRGAPNTGIVTEVNLFQRLTKRRQRVDEVRRAWTNTGTSF